MATATVTGKILNPDRSAQQNLLVRAYLYPATTPFAADGSSLVAAATTTTATDGTFSLSLERTDTMSPSGMVYAVVCTPQNAVGAQSGPLVQYITVPAGGGTIQSLLTTQPITPLSPGNAAVGNLSVTGTIATPTTVTALNAVNGPLRDNGGMVYHASHPSVNIVADGTDQSTKVNTLLTAMYPNKGGTVYLPPGDFVISGRIVLPNSTGSGVAGSASVGAIGSSVPSQPRYVFKGAGKNSSGTNMTRLILRYQSPNGTTTVGTITAPTSTTLSAATVAGVTTSLSVASGTGFVIGQVLCLEPGTASAELVTVLGVSGTTITLTGPTRLAHASSAAVRQPTTITVTGTAIPAGTFDIGFPVQVKTGTQQETVQIASVVVSGGTITSFKVTPLLSGYSTSAGATTISWPLRNDAKIVSLGYGDVVFEGLTLYSDQTNDKTPLLLVTNSRPHLNDVELIGWRGCTVFPSTWQTGLWPTQDGVILGGTSGQADGSLTGCYAGYPGKIDGNVVAFSLRSPVVKQSAVTTLLIQNVYVTSSCGSPNNIGGAFESYSALASQNNGITIFANALEAYSYQQPIWFGTQNRGNTVIGNPVPDAVLIRLTSSASALATTVVTDGYLPEIGMDPTFASLEYAIDTGNNLEYVRFNGAPTRAATTTLSGATVAGATSLVVASATGISAGTVILLDHGTYGLQEPVTVASSYVSGTTIPLTTALLFAHSNGVAVWVGPFTFTLQNALVNAHVSTTPISPNLAVVRNAIGSAGHFFHLAARDTATGVRDFYVPPAAGGTTNVVIDPGNAISTISGLTLPPTMQQAQGLANRFQFDNNPSGQPGYLFNDIGSTWYRGLSVNGYYLNNVWTYSGTSANKASTVLRIRDNGLFELLTSTDGSTTAPTVKFSVTAAGIYSLPNGGSFGSSTVAGALTFVDAGNIVLGTTTGTKIGTATNQKLGLWNATPVVQQVLATGAGHTVDDVITLLQTIGGCKQS